MTYYTNIKTPALGVMKFTILVDPYFIHSLSDLSLGVEKKNAISLNDYIWPNPRTRIPAPGVLKFTNLVDPSLVIITTYLVSRSMS